MIQFVPNFILQECVPSHRVSTDIDDEKFQYILWNFFILYAIIFLFQFELLFG